MRATGTSNHSAVLAAPGAPASEKSPQGLDERTSRGIPRGRQ